MIDKSSLLKSHGSLYLEFIPKDGLFHKMLYLNFTTNSKIMNFLNFFYHSEYNQDRKFITTIQDKKTVYALTVRQGFLQTDALEIILL